MKKILYFTGIFSLLITWISCSDDFLSKNNIDLYQLTDTLQLNNKQESVSVPVTLPVNVNCDYTIFMHPKWLSFNSMRGLVKNGSFLLDFNIVKNDLIAAFTTHYATIIINVEDLGMISFSVEYENVGFPSLQYSPSSFDFKTTDSRTFTVKNTSDGILKWAINGVPEWLTITPVSGSLMRDYTADVTVSVNLNNIDLEKETSGNFQISSNAT